MIRAFALSIALLVAAPFVRGDDTAIWLTQTGQEVIGAVAVSGLNSPLGAGTTHFRIVCGQNARIRYDSSAPTADANSLLLIANLPYYGRFATATTRLAAVQDTAASNCSIAYYKANLTTQKQQYFPGLNP